MTSDKLTPRENMLRVLGRNDPQYVPYRRRGRIIPGLVLVSSPNALAPKSGKDLWGTGWLAADGDWEAYPQEHPCATANDLANYKFPDITLMVAGLEEQAAAVDRNESLVIVHQPRGIFERSHLLLHMETLLIEFLDNPDALRHFYNRITDYYVEIAKLHCSMPIDGFRVTDDYGTQSSLLISPDKWREFIKPGLSRIVSTYKEAGKFFFLHSCGYLTKIMPDLVEIGIDVIDSLNPTAGNELNMWKKQYGDKLNFMGGVDTSILMFGTPQEVREEVKLRLRQLAAGGGFILAPDQSISVPDAGYQAYIETAEEYCTYPVNC